MDIYHRSLWLTIINATMIGRALGRAFPPSRRRNRIRLYKKLTIEEMARLSAKMDDRTLRRRDIHRSLDKVWNAIPGISFGQAQKGLNVLLKVHWFLYHAGHAIGAELDCPLDSKVLRSLGGRPTSLARIDRSYYMAKQEEIMSHSQLRGEHRVEYDRIWDEDHLRDEGLL